MVDDDGASCFGQPFGSEDLEIFLVAPMGHGGTIQHLASVDDISNPRSESRTRLALALQPRIVLLGLEPAVVDWGLKLSPSVADEMDELVEAASDQLRRWQVELIGKPA